MTFAPNMSPNLDQTAQLGENTMTFTPNMSSGVMTY